MTTTITTTLVAEECWNCGVGFGMTQQFAQKRHEDKRTFYCPNGHAAVYGGKPLDEQLTEAKRQAENDRLLAIEAQAAADRARAKLRRAKKRAAAGVCGFCHRQFQQVKAHVERQHPGEAQDSGIKVRSRKAIDDEAKGAKRPRRKKAKA